MLVRHGWYGFVRSRRQERDERCHAHDRWMRLRACSTAARPGPKLEAYKTAQSSLRMATALMLHLPGGMQVRIFQISPGSPPLLGQQYFSYQESLSNCMPYLKANLKIPH